MAGSSRKALSEALSAVLRLERSQVAVLAAVRTALVVTVLLLISIKLGRLDAGFSIVVGAVFAAICDPVDATIVRLRAMLWGTLWCAVGLLAGGLVSDYASVHAVSAFIFAAACGFAGALGARGSLFGVLTLVLFAVYSGFPIGTGISLEDTGYFLIGAAVTMVVCLAPAPLRLMGTSRESVAVAYRRFAEATHRTGAQLAAPVVAAAISNAAGVVNRSGAEGETRDWFTGQLTALEEARLALLALIAERHTAPGYVDPLIHSAAGLTAVLGRSLTTPRYRRRIPTALTRLEVTAASSTHESAARLGGDLVEPLRRAANAVQEPWPVGRRATIGHATIPRTSISERLRQHAVVTDLYVEHALRLSVAFGIATLVAIVIPLGHSFWLPLTVAWVAKPDLAGTVTKVTLRVAGTIAGILAVAAATFVTHNSLALAIGVGVATYLAVAYLLANYAIAVIGITVIVIALEALQGENAITDIGLRCLFTIIAGLWVLLISMIRPRRAGPTAVDALARTCAALRGYATAVRTQQGLPEARAEVLKQRSLAVVSVAAVTAEPPGIFERPQPPVDADQAAAVLGNVIEATAAIVAEDLLTRDGEPDPHLWPEIESSLDSLDDEIDALRPQPAG